MTYRYIRFSAQLFALRIRRMNTKTSTATSSAATQTPQESKEGQGTTLVVLAGLILGTMGVFVVEAGQDPITTTAFRCAFGCLALLCWGTICGRLGELKLPLKAWLGAVVTGGLMAASWALHFAAIPRTSIGVGVGLGPCRAVLSTNAQTYPGLRRSEAGPEGVLLGSAHLTVTPTFAGMWPSLGCHCPITNPLGANGSLGWIARCAKARYQVDERSTRQSLPRQEPLSLALQHSLREFEEIRKIPLSPSV